MAISFLHHIQPDVLPYPVPSVPAEPMDAADNAIDADGPQLLDDSMESKYDTDESYYSEGSDDEVGDVVTDLINETYRSWIPPITRLPATASGRVSNPVPRYGKPELGDYDPDDQAVLRDIGLVGAIKEPADPDIPPRTYKQATSHRDAEQYMLAAAKEVASMAARGVYELVPLPPGERAIGCQWVFTVKRDDTGVIVKYKGRIVARGDYQEFGVNYTDTFAPVVRFGSIRLIIALAVHYRMKVHQVDFVTAFLNAPLDEEIYMRQPEGFRVHSKNGTELVWRLRKAIYGLEAIATPVASDVEQDPD